MKTSTQKTIGNFVMAGSILLGLYLFMQFFSDDPQCILYMKETCVVTFLATIAFSLLLAFSGYDIFKGKNSTAAIKIFIALAIAILWLYWMMNGWARTMW